MTPLAIFPILLSEIHSSPSGKFLYTYQLKLPVWRVVIIIQYGKNSQTVYSFFCVYQCCKICYIRMEIFTTLRGEIHNRIQHKLQNSMEVDSVGIIVILSMSYITTRIVKTQTSVAKIPRVPVENQITTLSVVKIAIKFSSCMNDNEKCSPDISRL